MEIKVNCSNVVTRVNYDVICTAITKEWTLLCEWRSLLKYYSVMMWGPNKSLELETWIKTLRELCESEPVSDQPYPNPSQSQEAFN